MARAGSLTAVILLVFLFIFYFSATIFFSIQLVSAAEIDIKYDFDHQEERALLNGRHINIGTIEFAPTVYIEHDANGKLSRVDGIAYQIVLWLAAKYNFTFTFIEPPDLMYGSYVKGKWNGMIRQLIDQEVEMVAFPLAPTYQRFQVVDFPIHFGEDEMTALIPPSRESNKLIAVIKPFKIEVWVLIILSFLSVGLVTWFIIEKFEPKYIRKPGPDANEFSLTKYLFIIFGILVTQSNNVLPLWRSHSSRTAVGFWCLASIVFIYAYSGCLTSFMAFPKWYPIVNNLDELANSSELQVVTWRSHFFETILLDSKTGTYKQLADSILAHPENRLSTDFARPEKLAPLARTGKYAFLNKKSLFGMVIELDLKNTGKCGMSLMNEVYNRPRCAFALAKKSPYFNMVDKAITIMRDTGCLNYWEKQYTSRINKCTAPVNTAAKRRHRLNLSDMSGAFLVLGIGITASFIAFIVENFIAKSTNRCWCATKNLKKESNTTIKLVSSK